MKKNEIKIVVTITLLSFSIVFTLIQILFKQQFVSSTSQIINIGSWVFGITSAAMIPGIVYKGGEGYSLVFNKFTLKEQAFLWFILELIIGFLIGALFIWLFSQLLEHYYMFVHLIILGWILVVYIWFSKFKNYSFPWYYTLITLAIIILNSYLIVKFY